MKNFWRNIKNLLLKLTINGLIKANLLEKLASILNKILKEHYPEKEIKIVDHVESIKERKSKK